MSGNLIEYERYFAPRQMVRIALMPASGEASEIRAIVTDLTRDLLELELEDDALSLEAGISVGDTVELRSGREGNGFRCRALLVGGTTSRYFLVRLVGDIILEELREFFRIDTYLPLRYALVPDWDDRSARQKWLELVEQRTQEEQEPASFIYHDEPDDSAYREPPLMPLYQEPPVAANISGGGLRTVLSAKLEPDSLALLEIYVSGPHPRIVEVVGKVLFTTETLTHDGKVAFNTAFKFTCIQERDRDLIISHIQRLQRQQLRQISAELPLRRILDDEAATIPTRPLWRRLRIAAMIISCLVLLGILVNYYRHPVKNEIQIIFEKGIRAYLERLPQREK